MTKTVDPQAWLVAEARRERDNPKNAWPGLPITQLFVSLGDHATLHAAIEAGLVKLVTGGRDGQAVYVAPVEV